MTKKVCESVRGAKKELWEFLMNCLTSGQFTGFISSRKIRNEHSSWKLSRMSANGDGDAI